MGLTVRYIEEAAEDIEYWQVNDKKIYKRIQSLIDDMKENPFTGIGKPEALKYNLAGKWSRRITAEHRLVYELKNKEIIIYQCRFHY